MNQHTPGPWSLSWSPTGGYQITADPRVHGDMKRGLVFVATIYFSEDRLRKSETQANMRLMTHSPEMLNFLERVQSLNVISGIMGDELVDLIQKVSGSS